ncbi:uncharacterized protein [Physcomitrium patens]|uniref:Phytocyanin domain-containing protein n=1 Tax=Physcomitrium patens TaxID=3218 RepID=A9SIW7_PHYPA|nr:uncharacterized protein LOC112292469 [Physcomitrium patens]PNR39060.1 hypothetical protein PHYPA_019338 [Physcomitrium patens]|eukprot:XP_024396766.1 uncharacterized protein LOC112292469 [Physcomitrella patens]
MGSGARSSFLLVAPVLCAAMLLGLFVDHCACQTPQIYTLGGAAGWTDVANKKYTAEMAAVPFKAGDTILFNNNDTKVHDVLQVYTQEDYDTCNTNGQMGWTLNPGDTHGVQLIDPAYRVWFFDTVYCLTGQKVEFTVRNSDGTVVPLSTGADPPSLNAPVPEPVDPNVPPPPVGIAGGPAPNAAGTNGRVTWISLVAIASVSYFATFVL